MWASRDWTDVRPGDYVQEPTGVIYHFQGRDALGNVTLTTRDGRPVNIGRPGGAVWVWDGPMEQAVQTIIEHLGGRIIADSTVRRP